MACVSTRGASRPRRESCVRSCALAAIAAKLRANVASSAFGVTASGDTLAVKNGLVVMTLAKLPESGGSAAMMFL